MVHAQTSSSPDTASHDLPVVGGNSCVPSGTDPKLAQAAVDPNTVVIHVDGQTVYEDIQNVDANKVELACNDQGCALVPNSGKDD